MEYTQEEIAQFAEAKLMAWQIALGYAFARNPAALDAFKQDLPGMSFGTVREELRPKLASALAYLISIHEEDRTRRTGQADADHVPAHAITARKPSAVTPMKLRPLLSWVLPVAVIVAGLFFVNWCGWI